MTLRKLIKGCISLVALLACMSATAGSRDITVSLSADKRGLDAHEDVLVTVTMTNTSSTPQHILKWHTPVFEVEESLFDVYRDGKKLDYLGAHYKRQAPTKNDYFTLNPGKSHTQKVELSGLYDMSISGEYTISYHTKSFQLFASNFEGNGLAQSPRELGEMKSNLVAISIKGRLPSGTVVAKESAPSSLAGTLSYSKCTSSQISTIGSAVSAALSMASDADTYLASGALGARYATWFGTGTANYSTVKTHFVAIKDAFATKPITVDCSCKKTYYAYVYPNQPYKIYVCKAFWTAPMTGTDSMGGTLVHEMSHFTAVAGTDDWVYGQTGAKSLAISDPAKAIDNADSHEYFGENTPFQQ